MTKHELIEVLAAAEHASWARWMDYLFSKCEHHLDGSATIPAWAVQRWSRQAATEYADLEDDEQKSDRDEVARILPAINTYANTPPNEREVPA